MKKVIALLFICFIGTVSHAQFEIKGAWVGQLDGGYFKLKFLDDNEVFFVYDEDTLYSMEFEKKKLSMKYNFQNIKDTSLLELIVKVNNVVDRVESFKADVILINKNRMKLLILYEGDDEEDIYEVVLERLKN